MKLTIKEMKTIINTYVPVDLPLPIWETLQADIAEYLDNKPLTVEELKQMDGEPVWVVPNNKKSIAKATWALVNVQAELVANRWINLYFERLIDKSNDYTVYRYQKQDFSEYYESVLTRLNCIAGNTKTHCMCAGKSCVDCIKETCNQAVEAFEDFLKAE